MSTRLKNILVCSKISIPAKDRTLPAWEYVRSQGLNVAVEHPSARLPFGRPDVLISMGVTVMDDTFLALKRYPGVPLFCYNWDVYEWVWTRPRKGEYDYRAYGDLLRKAREVWVPSRCTGERTQQWYGLANWHVILSACPWWDWPDDDVRDDGYALLTLREIPDPHWGRFEAACEDLGIPYRCTRHEVSYQEYQQAVAHCRFQCSPLWELSTGGLSLMEGYYHGKPCLLSDSPWHGGRDYMGGRACYFNHADEADFRHWLLKMHRTPPPLNVRECREWITRNYSDARMMDDMIRRMLLHLGG